MHDHAASPAYALRSYLYILLHASIGEVANFFLCTLLGLNKARKLSI
jgi:hypothetical protein